MLKNNFDKFFNYIYIIEKFSFLEDLKSNTAGITEGFINLNDNINKTNMRLCNESN